MPLLEDFVVRLDRVRQVVREHAASRIGTVTFRDAVADLGRHWKLTREEVARWGIFSPPALDYIEKRIAWLSTEIQRLPGIEEVRVVIQEARHKVDESLIPTYEASLWCQFRDGYDSLLADERPLFDEAFRCMPVECYRAAILLMWAVAAARLRQFISGKMGWARFNAASKGVQAATTAYFKAFTRPYSAATQAELSLVPDAHILVVLLHESTLDATEYAALQECLERRHTCGHPGRYSPGLHKCLSQAEDVFSTVIQNPRLRP